MNKIKFSALLFLFFLSPVLYASTCNYGSQYLERGEYKKAYNAFKSLSTLNEACALYYLGIMYQNGYYVKQSNKKAQKYIQRSAKKGFVPTEKMELDFSD